jgi:hypothetical protein
VKPMSPKQRMIHLLHGEAIDSVPFVQYHNMNAKNEEIWDLLGFENMGVLEWVSAYRIETPHCHIEHEAIREGDRSGWRDTLTTPVGRLSQRRILVPQLNGPTGTVEHYVKTLDDYRILRSYLEDFRIVQDISTIEGFHRRVGEGGIPHVSLPRTPFQALWIEWVSIEDLILHLQDAPDLLNGIMELLGDILLRTLEITADAVGKVEFHHVTMGDNITAPVIGRSLFRTWCVPFYNEIADRLQAKGIPFFVHMDGDLKPIWEEIDGCRNAGFDSLSPPPDNDTGVGQALARWPDKFVWANFPSSVHIQEPEAIYRKAMALLEEGGHSRRFWIQVSEDAPPGIWRRSFPEIVHAIRDFGAP